ncbi:hypothetical protein DFH08DRAFT_825762 [Mycena albidolilacea]|uniref:Uncharacterized protein n=1 Tax=Mycena albidolilacea TaxID=1033008 RepID=A0AAD7E951_9AGAR|nr:hypothetical protein DFH08DRAFT_825762 [Mycena albidolilacea]
MSEIREVVTTLTPPTMQRAIFESRLRITQLLKVIFEDWIDDCDVPASGQARVDLRALSDADWWKFFQYLPIQELSGLGCSRSVLDSHRKRFSTCGHASEGAQWAWDSPLMFPTSPDDRLLIWFYAPAVEDPSAALKAGNSSCYLSLGLDILHTNRTLKNIQNLNLRSSVRLNPFRSQAWIIYFGEVSLKPEFSTWLLGAVHLINGVGFFAVLYASLSSTPNSTVTVFPPPVATRKHIFSKSSKWPNGKTTTNDKAFSFAKPTLDVTLVREWYESMRTIEPNFSGNIYRHAKTALETAVKKKKTKTLRNLESIDDSDWSRTGGFRVLVDLRYRCGPSATENQGTIFLGERCDGQRRKKSGIFEITARTRIEQAVLPSFVDTDHPPPSRHSTDVPDLDSTQ